MSVINLYSTFHAETKPKLSHKSRIKNDALWRTRAKTNGKNKINTDQMFTITIKT